MTLVRNEILQESFFHKWHKLIIGTSQISKKLNFEGLRRHPSVHLTIFPPQHCVADLKPASCTFRVSRHLDSMLLLFLGFFLSVLAVRLSRSKTFFLSCGTMLGCMTPLVLLLVLARAGRQRLLRSASVIASVTNGGSATQAAHDRTERKLAAAAADGNSMAVRMLANYQETRQRGAAIAAANKSANGNLGTANDAGIGAGGLPQLVQELAEAIAALRSRFALLLMALIILSLHVLFYVWEHADVSVDFAVGVDD